MLKLTCIQSINSKKTKQNKSLSNYCFKRKVERQDLINIKFQQMEMLGVLLPKGCPQISISVLIWMDGIYNEPDLQDAHFSNE